MKALDEWTVIELEDEAASLAARIAAATGRLLEILAELDRRGAVAEGFVSLAHWLSWRTGIRLPAAREHVPVARALRELPDTSAALRDGAISYSKARAVTRVARRETEAQLLELAKQGTTAQLERIVRGVRVAGDCERERAARIQDRRQLDCFYDDDGMLVIRGRLSPEEGALLLKALDAARDRGPGEDAAADRAAALARVADLSLGGVGRTGADRSQVVIHVDHAVLGDPTRDGRSQVQDGPSVSAETSRRVACDAVTVVMRHGPGGRVDAGRKTRVISAALRRALVEREHGRCSFPGCHNRIVDGHHAIHWADGGATVLENTTLVCRRHHVLVHERGYGVRIEGLRVRFFRPDGREIAPAPVPPPGPDLPPLAGEPPWAQPAHWAYDQHPDYDWTIHTILESQSRPESKGPAPAD